MRRPSPLTIVLAGAIVISFSAILFRASGTSPITGAFFRTALAWPALMVIRRFWGGIDQRILRERWLAAGAGAFLALDIVAWHTAIENVGTGLATLTANSQVVMVPLITWLLLRERPSNRALAAMLPVMLGLALLTGLGREDSFGERPVFGVLIAIVAALFYSGFLIGFRQAGRSLAHPAAVLADVVAGAVVVMGVVGVVSGDLDLTPGAIPLAYLSVLALSSQVFGWLAVGYALPRLEAASTSFAILLQPVLTIVWGALIFSEKLSFVQGLGVAVVLGGILYVTTERAVIPRFTAGVR